MKKHNVQDSEFTLLFEPVMSGGGAVRLIDHSRNRESNVKIAVDDSAFSYRVQKEFPSIIADLIDLAIAIHAADRLTFQSLRKNQTLIHVVLPVRHPEILNQTPLQDKLSNLLEWATGSRWVFESVKRVDLGRTVEQQPLLSSADPHVDEVALWSGGLDALAGLYTRLKENPEISFMLFGTGSNDNAYARQEQVFQALQPSFPNRLNLCRAPIRFSESNLHTKNKISRARGIVFTLLGSACTYLMGQRVLHLYENGIGAINLPYRKSAVGLDHSRSVHPLTLLGVGNLISELIGEEFRVRNPLKYSENTTTQWKSLTKRFPELDDIVDRTHEVEGLTSLEMRKCLIRLYQTYVSEWDTVEPQISGDFLSQVSTQQVSQDFQLTIQ